MVYGIEYAVRGDPDDSHGQVKFIEELKTVFYKREKSGTGKIVFQPFGRIAPSFPEMIINLQLIRYVDTLLKNTSIFGRARLATSLLEIAVRIPSSTGNSSDLTSVCHEKQSAELIQLLLDYGADPIPIEAIGRDYPDLIRELKLKETPKRSKFRQSVSVIFHRGKK